jgi:hypothetical protein
MDPGSESLLCNHWKCGEGLEIEGYQEALCSEKILGND